MDQIETPERLLLAGIELFAKHGFDGTSVKQIADQAGVNVSLVSYHFKGKEGLYRACFEHYGREKTVGSIRILKNVESKEELKIRLNLFLEEFWGTNIKELDLMCMIHREEETGFTLAHDIFADVFVKLYQAFVDVMADAQKKNFLRQDLDIKMVSSVFFGSMIHSLTKDQMSEKFFGTTLKDPAYRTRYAKTLVSTILEGSLTE